MAGTQKVRNYNIQGRFLSDGIWTKFKGEIKVRPDRIVVGRNLSEEPNQLFNLYGILVEWNDHRVLIFLKKYHDNEDDNRCFYYHLYDENPEAGCLLALEGDWKGNWSSDVRTEARSLIDSAVIKMAVFEDSSALDRIEEELQSSKDKRDKHPNPIVAMKDMMAKKTANRYKGISVSVEVTLEYK